MVEASSRVSPPPLALKTVLWFIPSGSQNLLPLGSNFAVMALLAPGFGESRCSSAKAKRQGTMYPRRKTKATSAINQRAGVVFLRKYCIASTALDPTKTTAAIVNSPTQKSAVPATVTICPLLLKRIWKTTTQRAPWPVTNLVGSGDAPANLGGIQGCVLVDHRGNEKSAYQ